MLYGILECELADYIEKLVTNLYYAKCTYFIQILFEEIATIGTQGILHGLNNIDKFLLVMERTYIYR